MPRTWTWEPWKQFINTGARQEVFEFHLRNPDKPTDPAVAELMKGMKDGAAEAPVPSLPPSREDLEYDGYTSSDSFSDDIIVEQVNWRVQQMHRELSTNMEVTQYWHYVELEPGNEGIEHQDKQWGTYREPINFHLRLRELTNITYALNSRNIIIGTKPVEGVSFRGDLVAQFKRERTKRRFLKFMEGKGIRLIETRW